MSFNGDRDSVRWRIEWSARGVLAFFFVFRSCKTSLFFAVTRTQANFLVFFSENAAVAATIKKNTVLRKVRISLSL